MSKRHRQAHLFPIISTMLVLVGIILVVEADIDYNEWIITSAALLYFVSNLIYGHIKKELTVIRVLELGAVTVMLELIALQFLI